MISGFLKFGGLRFECISIICIAADRLRPNVRTVSPSASTFSMAKLHKIRAPGTPRSLLIFVPGISDTAERDLGAGRTLVALRGSSGMDAARAAPRHGWRMAAGPRSVACVREPRRRRGQTGSQSALVTFALFESDPPTGRKGDPVSPPQTDKHTNLSTTKTP